MTPDELPADMEARTPAPEGEAWRTVPVEPTEAMLVNGREALMPLVRLDSYGPLIGVWEDMLAASPVVPVGVSEVLDAAAAYLKEQYGASHGLDHPVDRARILAALRPTDTGWRDIATAPRDGTRLVLWDLSRAVFGSWRVDEGFSSKEPMWLDESYDDYSCGFASNPLEPTYWMPIPPAPTDTGRE